MNDFSKKTIIVTLPSFKKEEVVILGEDEASVTFLIKKADKAFLGYAARMKEMELIPLDDVIVSALITAYGKRQKIVYKNSKERKEEDGLL